MLLSRSNSLDVRERIEHMERDACLGALTKSDYFLRFDDGGPSGIFELEMFPAKSVHLTRLRYEFMDPRTLRALPFGEEGIIGVTFQFYPNGRLCDDGGRWVEARRGGGIGSAAIDYLWAECRGYGALAHIVEHVNDAASAFFMRRGYARVSPEVRDWWLPLR